MAAPVIQDEISIGEQSEVSIPDYIIQSSNLKANLNSSAYPKSLQIIIECLKSSVLMRALTLQKEIPKSLVNLAFSKATFVKEQDIVSFAVHGGRTLTISKKNFIRLMELQDTGYYISPTAEELIGMFNQMGCTPMLTKISQFKKNKLPFLWNFLFTIFKRCLCGRKSGLDSASQLFLSMMYGIYYNVQIDYGSILWYEFTESVKVSMAKAELTSHRFWSVIVESAYSIAKIPIDTTEEPKITFNEFQVPKKIPSQPEFEFVGQIPVSMIGRIPLHSEVLMAFKSETSQNFPLRVIPEAILNEIQTQNVKVSLKRKEIAESSEVEITKHKKKKTKLSTLVLVDESDENETDIEGMEERENPVKQSKRLKKGKKLRKELQTPTLEILKKSKKRRLRLAADLDDDVHPISHVFSIASSLNVIDPIAEAQEVGNLNEENMERDVHNFEEETAQGDTAQADTAQDDTMTVRTEVINEEEMGGEDVRIENETVNDEVAQETVNTTVAEENALAVSEVDTMHEAEIVNEAIVSEVNTTNVSTTVVNEAEIVNDAEGVNEAVVTEVVTTEVSAQVVNQELDASEEYRTENLHVVNESEEDTNADVDQSCSVPPPITQTGSEQILTSTSDSCIFSDLRNLNVTLPVISPVIQSTTQQQEKEIMFENISFTGGDLGFDDEELDMAPIDLMRDDNENENENELMSIKQFRILNRKLNMLLRISERPADLSTSRESELDKVSLEWNEKFNLLNAKMSNLGERFDGFKDTMKNDNANLKNEVHELKNEVKNLDDEVRRLNSEIAKLSDKNVEELKLRIDEMNKEKSTIQKSLDEALAHIQFLEPSIKIYDQKELADDYNRKVVQHVELVQRDFMSKLAPLQKLLSVLPKIPISSTAVPVNKSSSTLSPTVRMDYPLFSVSSQTITQPTSIPILIPQRILQKAVVIGSSAPMQTTSTVVTTYAGSSSNKGKAIIGELSEEERRKRDLELRQQLSLMRQGELFKNTGESKIWSEETIRNLAFGEDNFFSYVPKLSYNTDLQPGMQLDLPQLPKLFTVKCFKLSSSVKLSTNDYNESLIRFYGRVGLEESQVWSLSALRKIIKVEKGDLFENIFQNFDFTVERGDSKSYIFTLADLPILNPMDLINILKSLYHLEKIDVTILLNHLRSLLYMYVYEIATKDMAVAQALGKEIVRPLVSCDGLGKFPDGKIIQQPDWGVVYSATVKGKLIKRLFRIDDKGKFSNSHILGILKRIVAFDDNSVKELSEVSGHLNWTMGVRKVILEAIPVIFKQ